MQPCLIHLHLISLIARQVLRLSGNLIRRIEPRHNLVSAVVYAAHMDYRPTRRPQSTSKCGYISVMQHTWTIVQHYGPNHLEMRLYQSYAAHMDYRATRWP